MFDCNSGDYWVLSELAGSILQIVNLSDHVSMGAIHKQLARSHPEVDLPNEVPETIRSLIDNRLLCSENWRSPTRENVDDLDD